MKLRLMGSLHSCLVRASHPARPAKSWRAWVLSTAITLCTGLLITGGAQATFQVVEDFDSLTPGNINGQNDWVATSGSGEVVPDPADGSNQALKVSTMSGTLRKVVSIAQGTTRMLFLRFRFEEHSEFSFGFSHLLKPYQHSDFGPELGMASATASDPNNEFRVANGLSPSGVYDVLKTLTPGSWYNVWVLVDNTSSTYQVWMHSTPYGDAQASNQLKNSAAESVFGFRTVTGKDLINFFIKTGTGDSPVDGRFYLDDIYLEDSDGIHLNNPLGQSPTTTYLPWLLLLLDGDS